MPHRRRRGTPAYKVTDIQAHIDHEPGGPPEETDHESTIVTNLTIDNIYASVDTERLVSSFVKDPTAYTYSVISDTLVTTNYSVDPILILHNSHKETKIEGKLKVDHVSVSSVYEQTVDAVMNTEINTEIVTY